MPGRALDCWTLVPHNLSGTAGHYARRKATVVATQVMELYMLIKDPDLFRRLMESKRISARQLAQRMGWASHSYVNRLRTGTVNSVTPDAAVKIAYLLEVPVDLIFVPRVSGETRRTVRRAS